MLKPIIGVTPGISEDEKFYKVSTDNLAAIEKAGGIPLVLSYLSKAQDIKQIVEKIDGLYLTGGDDIDPKYFNEDPHPNIGAFNPKRDALEMKITKLMLTKNKPILGVCKGTQMLNLAAGGDMYQDIYAQIDTDLIQHRQKAPRYVATHDVKLIKDSLIYQILGKENIRVNSLHHQANRQVGKGFIVSGKAADGVIEAIESLKHRFVLGLQWHPEMLAIGGNDAFSLKIYEAFIVACQNKRIRH